MNKEQLIKAFADSLESESKFSSKKQETLYRKLENTRMFETILPMGNFIFCAGCYKSTLSELHFSTIAGWNHYETLVLMEKNPTWSREKATDYAGWLWGENHGGDWSESGHDVYITLGLLINNKSIITKAVTECYVIDYDKYITPYSSIIRDVDLTSILRSEIPIPNLSEVKNGFTRHEMYFNRYNDYIVDPSTISLDCSDMVSISILKPKNLISFSNVGFVIRNTNHLAKIMTTLKVADIKRKTDEEHNKVMDHGLTNIANAIGTLGKNIITASDPTARARAIKRI